TRRCSRGRRSRSRSGGSGNSAGAGLRTDIPLDDHRGPLRGQGRADTAAAAPAVAPGGGLLARQSREEGGVLHQRRQPLFEPLSGERRRWWRQSGGSTGRWPNRLQLLLLLSRSLHLRHRSLHATTDVRGVLHDRRVSLRRRQRRGGSGRRGGRICDRSCRWSRRAYVDVLFLFHRVAGSPAGADANVIAAALSTAEQRTGAGHRFAATDSDGSAGGANGSSSSSSSSTTTVRRKHVARWGCLEGQELVGEALEELVGVDAAEAADRRRCRRHHGRVRSRRRRFEQRIRRSAGGGSNGWIESLAYGGAGDDRRGRTARGARGPHACCRCRRSRPSLSCRSAVSREFALRLHRFEHHFLLHGSRLSLDRRPDRPWSPAHLLLHQPPAPIHRAERNPAATAAAATAAAR
ncbi:unnamed protein product, partial [Scytosiphon promiscuus]